MAVAVAGAVAVAEAESVSCGVTWRRSGVAPMGAPREAWKRRADSMDAMIGGRGHRALEGELARAPRKSRG